jgi:hypothetical protein
MKSLRFLGFAFLLTLALPAFAMQVAISEIMYHPAAASPTTTKPEFIEIWNVTATPLDMAKWRLVYGDGYEFQFPDFNTASPQSHILKGQERIVISSADEATTRAAYPGIPTAVRVFGPWRDSGEAGDLNNSGERITLQDKNGVILSSVSYKDSGRWPKRQMAQDTRWCFAMKTAKSMTGTTGP